MLHWVPGAASACPESQNGCAPPDHRTEANNAVTPQKAGRAPPWETRNSVSVTVYTTAVWFFDETIAAHSCRATLTRWDLAHASMPAPSVAKHQYKYSHMPGTLPNYAATITYSWSNRRGRNGPADVVVSADVAVTRVRNVVGPCRVRRPMLSLRFADLVAVCFPRDRGGFLMPLVDSVCCPWSPSQRAIAR